MVHEKTTRIRACMRTRIFDVLHHSPSRSYALWRQAAASLAARARTKSSLPAVKALRAPYHGAAHGTAAPEARRYQSDPQRYLGDLLRCRSDPWRTAASSCPASAPSEGS